MACKYPYDNCRCYERMGNDFWFLPTGMCLDDPPKAVLGVGHNNDKDDANVPQNNER
jgi:hypothetical protein